MSLWRNLNLRHNVEKYVTMYDIIKSGGWNYVLCEAETSPPLCLFSTKSKAIAIVSVVKEDKLELLRGLKQ